MLPRPLDRFADHSIDVPVPQNTERHGVPNVWVVDGSVLPTGLGVNPSESIYAIAHWAVDQVATG